MSGLEGDLLNWPFVMVTFLHKLQALGIVFKKIRVVRLEFLQYERKIKGNTEIIEQCHRKMC